MSDTSDDKLAAESAQDDDEFADQGDLKVEGDLFSPEEDAEAEPFWALMELGPDGTVTGSVWSFGGRLMLFQETEVADKVLGSISSEEAPFVLRGVTHDHLQALKNLASTSQIPLFVVVGIAEDGRLEAHAIAEVETPPLPPGLD